MNDKAIRGALLRLIRIHDSEAAVYEEFPLSMRAGRADCAVVNGHFTGFEIKSDCDTLSRLPQQIRHYETVFDFCYAVVVKKHLGRLRQIIPQHWGIYLAEESDGKVTLSRLRKAKQNRTTDTYCIVRLMWKPEIIRALRSGGMPIHPNDSIVDLWDKVQLLPKRWIAENAREALKARAMRRCA